MVDFCDKFKKDIIEFAFTQSGTILNDNPTNVWYCWTPRYQQYWTNLNDIISVCGMLGIKWLDDRQSEMIERVKWLNTPDTIQQRYFFESHIDCIKQGFEPVESQIKEKLQLLDREEIDRLNEALRCYLEGCNHAAIAMSVSAIEFRLLSLMNSKCPTAKLEELTLGRLIGEYLSNKQKYGSVIPEKHEPLLQHCNVYRIFSVHPKKERITKAIATSIINMTFAFLLDEDMKRRTETK
jgi:hypothetical protein